jgi:hypothetical protein
MNEYCIFAYICVCIYNHTKIIQLIIFNFSIDYLLSIILQLQLVGSPTTNHPPIQKKISQDIAS